MVSDVGIGRDDSCGSAVEDGDVSVSRQDNAVMAWSRRKFKEAKLGPRLPITRRMLG